MKMKLDLVLNRFGSQFFVKMRRWQYQCPWKWLNDEIWLKDPDLLHKGNRVIHKVTLSSPCLQHQCRLFTLGVQWPKWAPIILF